MRGSFGGPFQPFGGGRGILGAATTVVARTAVTGGFAESLSASITNSSPTSPRAASGHGNKLNSKLSISSATSPMAAPRSDSTSWPPSQYDDYFRVYGNGNEDEEEMQKTQVQEFWLGPAPSSDEVHSAVSALQQLVPNLDIDVDPSVMMHHVSSVGSDLDWIEPTLPRSNSRSLQSFGYGSDSDSESVVHAFHLLRTDLSVQEMVVSLSQDRAVWGAVMNNEVVRELIEECHAVGVELSTTYPDTDTSYDKSSNETDTVIDAVRQVINHAKTKLREMIHQITQVVSELFKLVGSPHVRETDRSGGVAVDSVEGKLRASFMLCIVVLLIVVVSRARGAS